MQAGLAVKLLLQVRKLTMKLLVKVRRLTVKLLLNYLSYREFTAKVFRH